jgi:ATP-dependent helicase YprA (DUF1998 family)
MADNYSLGNLSRALPETLKQYLEAQYHIWDEYLVAERRRILDTPGVIYQPPYIEATPSYVSGKPYDQLLIPTEVRGLLSAASTNSITGIPTAPYAHQAKALEAFFADTSPPTELAISTGTGSGKTESFLMPIVGSLALERSHRSESYRLSATRAILLYPMNALVNDQVSRLRRLLGSPEVATLLRRKDGRAANFGFYTSRTPYPGEESAARTRRDVGGWIKKLFTQYKNLRTELEREGKWPAKDLEKFLETFTTSAGDSELITRQEMQARPPDVLVTNYSMLEYMLLRPVDAPIFDKTQKWLEHPGNALIIVLDEAHLYQGAQGSEVSLLLRRLRSRLRVSRDRVRFILTSASLDEGTIRGFAGQLTGASDDAASFHVITGQLERPAPRGPLPDAEREAFATLDTVALHGTEQSGSAAATSISNLASRLRRAPPLEARSLSELQDYCYRLLDGTRAHIELAARIMGRPIAFDALARELFGDSPDAQTALDGLLAVMAFARRQKDSKVLLPSRAHMLFRGLEGIYACTNQNCSERVKRGQPTLLGRLYDRPRLLCGCGARVYELLTHRDCGAAYVRGYVRSDERTFLWHEPSTGALERERHLLEVHLLVEVHRDQEGDSDDVWVHTLSGRLDRVPPPDARDYLQLRWPRNGAVTIAGRPVLTFDRKCPVCLGEWQQANRPKIMDLVTKGEDPFAHLVASQVRLQPLSRKQTSSSPNGGRKSLLFSDGRQKAARLARDVPRVLELDAFRQTILLAARKLKALNKQPQLSDGRIYPAFVAAANEHHLTFFDGEDAVRLREHQQRFRDSYRSDLANALDEDEPWTPDPPAQFRAEIMRLLGNRHYSLYSLGLGFVTPSRRSLKDLERDLVESGISIAEVRSLAILWVDKLLADFSLYGSKVKKPARVRACGHPLAQVGSKTGFYRDQKRFLKQELPSLDRIDETFARRLTSSAGDSDALRLLDEQSLCLEPAMEYTWYRCKSCTYLAPVAWRNRCAWCGKPSLVTVPPEGDLYLRARKAFWRAPVERVLQGLQAPFTLSVEEHTAQLNYRDLGAVESTTEMYERRFRDIVLADERAIDVLSCTTTMEVGIDIGSLIGVGLRNMPPSRHNYQQRAGRAGRRGSAVSTVITYAQHNPHDAYLFENPCELIAGPPRPAGLDVNNAIIVIRHAYAELIQEYFNSELIREIKGNIFATLGRTEHFFTGSAEGTLENLAQWLHGPASSDTRRRLAEWLPSASGLTAAECVESLVETLSALRETFQRGVPRDEEQLIEFLFAHGVLPAYAFPRDLISLEIEEQTFRAETRERPQQSASIALSEYAPGRTVVVNKKTYRIGAVTAATLKDEVNRARPLFTNPAEYFQCTACLCTTQTTEGRENADCPVCQSAPMQRITVIQPQLVWPEGGKEVDELDDEQVFTDTTVAQLPIPSSDRAFRDDRSFGPTARLKFGRHVPLVVVNRGAIVEGEPTGFEVCRDCGFVALPGNPFPTSHERCYQVLGVGRSRRCNGSAARVYLGYEFKTDVSLLSIPLASPFVSDLQNAKCRAPLQAAAHSLANAIAITAASELGIDQRELQCGHRLRSFAGGGAVVDLYVYDTLAGGAGYSRLVGRHFDGLFGATLRRLADCKCDSSCAHCLRTYANRMTHAQLDRRLALDLARYAQEGVPPMICTPTEQHARLGPFLSMVRLGGWQVAAVREFGARITRGTHSVDIALRPALFDPDSVPASWRGALQVSDFEVDKDLPSCLLEIP